MTLEQMRLTQQVDVTFEVKGSAGDKMVPPLLFLPFIENAFKHGLGNSIKEPFIHCVLMIDERQLMFFVENSRSEQGAGHQGFGVSTTNLKRRLELLFPDAHTLRFEREAEKFTAFLQFSMENKTDQL